MLVVFEYIEATEERERREWGSKNRHSEVILTEENTWRHYLGKHGYRKSDRDEGTSYLEPFHVKGAIKVAAFLTNPSKPEISLFKIET